jgi:amino acid transporter
VFVISAAYRRIIEDFPHGGGGYVVASKLLGRHMGVVSGCALLVDYVLTVTVSIAAAGDALFSLLPLSIHGLKIPFEVASICLLTVLNIRGVKESVLALAPIFIIFLVTHFVMIVGGIGSHLSTTAETAHAIHTGFQGGLGSLGPLAMFLLFIHAYSMGGGTYTGIEAVSNGLMIMREPRVQTAKRTMTYMAFSLAATAGGLLLCYLLWQVHVEPGKTMNAVLLDRLTAGIPFGGVFIVVALLSEALLLVVGAQAGFIDGPRVLANMAIDSWMPRRFAALSERLTQENGILLMSLASLAALLYTGGDVSRLVVMYSINVFLTFSLSIFGMLKSYLKSKRQRSHWGSGIAIFGIGFVLCATILVITVFEKFEQGGWLTLLITAVLVVACFSIKQHYLDVAKKLRQLEISLRDFPKASGVAPEQVDPKARTAAILVAGYGGLGLHTLLSILNNFPGLYKNFVFVSVGVVDSGGFKGEDSVEELKTETERMLKKYVQLAKDLGFAATSRASIGTDVVLEAFDLCEQIKLDFPLATFFTGKVNFSVDTWAQRFLHNETGLALQKRLQLAGLTMVVLPAKVD